MIEIVDELEVKRLNKQYNFKINLFYDTIYLTSRFDEWIVEMCDDKFKLKHVNQNKTKLRSHTQHSDYYSSLESVLENIRTHDVYKENECVYVPILFA